MASDLPEEWRVIVRSWYLLLAAAACSSTGPDQPAVWSSDEVSLTVAESRTTLQFLASGGCYGSTGAIEQPIPSGSFTLSGTYRQLMGVYPGYADYPAEFSGVTSGQYLTLTINVPALQRTLGPFSLRSGVTRSWSACLYP